MTDTTLLGNRAILTLPIGLTAKAVATNKMIGKLVDEGEKGLNYAHS